jgi:steroid 5-alpha reductase family enzyme
MNPVLLALLVILGLTVVAWADSQATSDVSFVDSPWSLFFAAAAIESSNAFFPGRPQ